MANREIQKSLCKGGTLFVAGCRHCRAIAARQRERVGFQRLPQAAEAPFELLPPGEWKVAHNGSGDSNWGSIYDPANLRFLESLSPVAHIVSKQVFGRSRNYQGFIVKARSGEQIALLDTDKTQNALYVFDASDPSWLGVAIMKKNEVRKGVKNGSYPQCLAWMNHGTNFQKRVRDLLARL